MLDILANAVITAFGITEVESQTFQESLIGDYWVLKLEDVGFENIGPFQVTVIFQIFPGDHPFHVRFWASSAEIHSVYYPDEIKCSCTMLDAGPSEISAVEALANREAGNIAMMLDRYLAIEDDEDDEEEEEEGDLWGADDEEPEEGEFFDEDADL